ncbi:MAG: hypothetical protein AM325_006835 [Candidatus Thorarchaeota archaeon SMTZ1-45]|nr:MAG: hypothetical protein AM325_08575 [Candidatus Thorarchaeota archaeon SMTZ1-45]
MLLSKEIYKVYPIAWIIKSQVFGDYFSSVEKGSNLLIADFAAGEHDRVPSFFLNLLANLGTDINLQNRRVVYCTDLHALRLDSLLGKLEESNLLDNARVIHAKLETMDNDAKFRPSMIEYLKNNQNTMTQLDHHLLNQQFIPPEAFNIGVLNNDVVGYLHEYYQEYSNAIISLQKVHKTLKKGALLIVTMPCSLYVVDNVKILESVGFQYIDGKDVDISEGFISDLDRSADPQTLSRLGHYTFMIFIRN